MNYVVLRTAQNDIQAIDDWVASNFGDTEARKVQDELYRTFALLASFPSMGVRRPNLVADPIRFFSLSPNWIIYTPGDPLLIRRVYPARMDIRRLAI